MKSKTNGIWAGILFRRGREFARAFLPKDDLTSHTANSTVPTVQMMPSGVIMASTSLSKVSEIFIDISLSQP
jgi:hypothetical protein